MKNFLRALRCAWPYRVRLIISIVCALLAAVFWSLNFTAIYPVLKIIGSQKNLQEWVDLEIDRAQTKNVDPWQKQDATLNLQIKDLQSLPKSKVRDNMLRQQSGDLLAVE